MSAKLKYEEVKQIHDYRVPRNNDNFCFLSPAARAPTSNHSHKVIKWKQAVISHPLSSSANSIALYLSLKEVVRSTIRKKGHIPLTPNITSCRHRDLKFQRCLSFSSGTPDACLFVHDIGIKSLVVFYSFKHKEKYL